MEKQNQLMKGEAMEEHLRNYFNGSGYYVVRGVKFRYEGNDITDVDIYLYGRSSSLTRQRINIDIKNKKTPQAFERILWANGLQKLLNFDSCIVATTDKRSVVHSFGQLHKTTVLDGAFLSKLLTNKLPDRLVEEELLSQLAKVRSNKRFNKDWRTIYEMSKSRLLNEQDYSGLNSTLNVLEYFIQKSLSDEQRKEIATRMMYIIMSHILIIMDFILKDIAFLEQVDREKKLSDGLKFGNLGKDGVDKIISMAVHISGSKSASSFMNSLDNIPIDILKNFFSKNENTRNLFSWAREFEWLGYSKKFINPEQIETHLKSVISVMLDFFKFERRKFFGNYIQTDMTTKSLYFTMSGAKEVLNTYSKLKGEDFYFDNSGIKYKLMTIEIQESKIEGGFYVNFIAAEKRTGIFDFMRLNKIKYDFNDYESIKV